MSGLSDGMPRGAQQEGRLASRPVFALHAAGAPQIAHDCSWERGCFSHVEGYKSNSIARSFSPVRPRRRGAFAPARRVCRTCGRGQREAPTPPAPSAAPARCDGCASAYSATMNGAVARPQRGCLSAPAPGDFPSRCEPPPRTMVSWSDPGHRRRHEPPDRTPSLALAKGRRSEPPGSRATPPSRTPAVCT